MKTKEDYKNEFWNQIISDISYNYYDDFGEDYEEQIDEWAETFANRRMKEQEENNKELTKYKRAFEILKDEFGLEIKECCDKYKKAFKKDYQITSYSHRVFVTKDVAELLEELMKSE